MRTLLRCFRRGQSEPAIREGLHRFVAEGQQLLADYLDSRVGAGELRTHDSKTTAQALLSAVALGQITGADIEPDSLVDMVIRGVGAAVVNFSQRAAAGDAAQLEGIFDRFERWSRARSALQLLTLFSVAWALAAGIAGA